MKTATGLTLIALGAILAFAVNAHPSFLDLHVAGWVLMLTGAVGVVLPRTRRGRLLRRTVWRGERPIREVEVEETEVEPKFSQLIAPGGIASGHDDFRQEHERPARSELPDDTTGQPDEHDGHSQAGSQPVGR